MQPFSHIHEISVGDLKKAIKNNDGIWVDIRTKEEWAKGVIKGAQLLGRDHLESKIMQACKQKNEKIYLICQSGSRSIYAAKNLLDLGYTQVYSVHGGMKLWQQMGGEVVFIYNEDHIRYARQIKLKKWGIEGQKKIKASRILCLGMGGLGCPTATYLAASGVGHLTLVDNDHVELSNLHRQILYSDYQIGRAKVIAAKERLSQINPSIEIEAIKTTITKEKLADWVKSHDLIIEGTDQIINRYWLSDVCSYYKKPWVYGSVDRFSGQVALFNNNTHSTAGGLCYRCLFPDINGSESIKSCEEAGVLGVVPGVIGLLQATVALQYCAKINDLEHHLFLYDGLEMGIKKIKMTRRKGCKYCQ